MPRQREGVGFRGGVKGGCSWGRLVEESGICGSFENVGGSQIK